MQVNNGIPADQLVPAHWRTSTASNPSRSCVEVAEMADGAIAVRSSRHPSGPAPIYTRAEIEAFPAGAKNGEFDDRARAFDGMNSRGVRRVTLLLRSHHNGGRRYNSAVISCGVCTAEVGLATMARRGQPSRHCRADTGCPSIGSRSEDVNRDQRDGGSLADASSPTVPRMLLGIQLHRLREAAGISPEQAGYEIRASRSKISRIENGQVRFKERDVTDLLTLYGVTDAKMRAGLVALARQANAPGWWSKYGDVMADWFEAYLGLEAAASIIRSFELQFVHGLFQTEDYARAVTRLGHTTASEAEIDRRVSMRLKRQDLLAGAQPPQVWSVIDEGALRRPVGGAAVMRAQLARLIEVAALRHVTIQVVPFSRGGHAAAGGSFTILRFAEPDVPDVVYIEQLTSALYLDKHEDVDHYMEVMNHLSTEALTPAQSSRFLTEIIREI